MRIATALALWSLCSLASADQPWQVQPGASQLKFLAKQAGADFEGSFERFSADIRFDPKDLAISRFDVSIELVATTTKDEERDSVLKGPELFWVQRFPKARYVTDSIVSLGGARYSAKGKLTLRGVTADVPITFTFNKDGKTGRLIGTGALKRLRFGVGKGEYADTESIADDVTVNFSLVLKPVAKSPS